MSQHSTDDSLTCDTPSPCIPSFTTSNIFCLKVKCCNHITRYITIYYLWLLFTMHICQLLSCIWLLATPWTVACQAPLSMEFSRQEYWSGLPCPPPGDLPDPGIKPQSPALQADSLPPEPPAYSEGEKQAAACVEFQAVCYNISLSLPLKSSDIIRITLCSNVCIFRN